MVALSPTFCVLTDTGAVAVLALTCVKRSISNGKIKAAIKDSDTIQKYIESLVHKIQSEKNGGLFGNAYSTGEAMQVSQKVKQKTEGIMQESNILILPYWPPEGIASILFPTLTDLAHVIPLPCLNCTCLTSIFTFPHLLLL